MKKVYLIFAFVFFMILFSSRICALEEGIYTIHSAINDNYVLDVNGAGVYDGNNIQLYKSNRSNAQKFKVEKINDDYYKISSLLNYNYVITSGQYNNLSKIKIYKYSNINQQEWIIKNLGNNYYSIFSNDNIHCIDINSGIVQNNGIIQLYISNGSNAQRFRFEKLFEAQKTIPNGLYTISSYFGEDKVLDITNGRILNGTNIQQYQLNNTDAQKWYVNYLGNGYYSIKAYSNNNYSLDVAGAGKISGTNLQLYKSNNSAAQQWIISSSGDGYYNIVSKCNNLLLDIAYLNRNNGANVWLHSYTGTVAQKFKFNTVVENGTRTVSDGTYFINSSIKSSKSLDILNSNISEGTNVQLYDINYSLAQKWDIQYVDNGYYKILSNKDNEYALSVNDANGNVQINKYDGSNNQLWIIKKIGNCYYIISKLGKYLELAGATTYNGTNIEVFISNGLSAQKFSLIKTASGLSDKLINNGIYMISSALSDNMFIDIYSGYKSNYTNIQLWTRNGSNAQKFKVTYLSNGYYKISPLVDLSKSIEVDQASSDNGANAHIYDSKNTINQQWIIKDAGEGYYNIISNCSNYLSVKDHSIINGTNIMMWQQNDSKNQKFKFIPAMETTKVIDVSAHQGKIDWNKVYNTGIYGVILRIGTWETLDSRFYSYLDEVERLGLPYGIYLYSYASTTNGANIEANFTKNIINGTLKGHEGRRLNPILGIYYDIEDWYISEYNTSNILSKNDYDNIISTYITNVSSGISSKYKVKVYANSNYALNRFNDYARSQVDWLADYRGYKGYKGPISLWQYTSSATLNGINGYVDMSYLQ